MSNQSIERASAILGLFTYARPRLRVTQIAKGMGLPVSTVHGLVRTLEKEGLLNQDPASKEYTLGLRLHVLGSIHMTTLEINQKGTVPLNYLAKETGLVARLGVMHRGALVVTLDSLPLSKNSVAPFIGASVPAYCTSMGRAILAHSEAEEVDDYFSRVELVRYTAKTVIDSKALQDELAATRERGYSLSLQEFMPKVCSLGSPIFGERGQVRGAISVNGEPDQFDPADLPRTAARVLEAADEISRAMGYYGYLQPRFRDQAM